MTWIRHITAQFSPTYLRPRVLARAVHHIIPVEKRPHPHRSSERRCGVDRRQASQSVMLDTRNPYARRSGRRVSDAKTGQSIDVYV